MTTIWLVGRTDYDDEGKESMRWEVLGLYDDKDLAIKRCTRTYDCIAPINLNEDLPEETEDFPETEWPRL